MQFYPEGKNSLKLSKLRKNNFGPSEAFRISYKAPLNYL